MDKTFMFKQAMLKRLLVKYNNLFIQKPDNMCCSTPTIESFIEFYSRILFPILQKHVGKNLQALIDLLGCAFLYSDIVKNDEGNLLDFFVGVNHDIIKDIIVLKDTVIGAGEIFFDLFGADITNMNNKNDLYIFDGNNTNVEVKFGKGRLASSRVNVIDVPSAASSFISLMKQRYNTTVGDIKEYNLGTERSVTLINNMLNNNKEDILQFYLDVVKLLFINGRSLEQDFLKAYSSHYLDEIKTPLGVKSFLAYFYYNFYRTNDRFNDLILINKKNYNYKVIRNDYDLIKQINNKTIVVESLSWVDKIAKTLRISYVGK